MISTRRILFTAVLTTITLLSIVYQADALIDCYHCTKSGNNCDSSDNENEDEVSGGCSGSSSTKDKCTYCTTENKTNPNSKTIMKSRCQKDTYRPERDTCSSPGQPISCITSCNSSLCNYDCYSSDADQSIKPFLYQAILPIASLILIIMNDNLGYLSM